MSGDWLPVVPNRDAMVMTAVSLLQSNTGKLSTVKQPMPPEGSFLYFGMVPSNRFWQKASADTHMWAKSSPVVLG